MTTAQRFASIVAREQVAAAPRHWVGLGTACNNRCIFCLDGDKRAMLLPEATIREELLRGRSQGAERAILSGGEASVHPAFVDVIRLARTLGYAWVQTITNGVRFADPAFLAACVDAGLDEITFSVHGHTPQLHDRLTGHPGAFRAVVTAITRAVRTQRLVVSVDILMCRENIDVLDRIVETCIRLGVREFDLLQVIPHGRAFDNRDALLYEPAQHLSTLQRVLRLARHPELTIWTNRLPARYLEGFEELIQDPHKLHDEVRGRELPMRAWLDDGVPLPCRQPERCRSCCLEELCAFVERVVQRTRAIDDSRAPAEPAAPMTLTLDSPELLDACFAGGRLQPGVAVRIDLNERTAAWMLRNRSALERSLAFVRIHQPGPERLGDASAHPVDPRSLLGALNLPVAVSGLPRCMLAGALEAEEPETPDAGLLDPSTGRVDLHTLVASFIRDGYRVKSLRCTGCAQNEHCSGLQINLARAFGLGALTPLGGPVEVS